jgi:2-polyprenyl-6-methoxyphenol hydroxylase-like FAD-dependent oxidoreductase
VGADGAWSKVRDLLTDVKPFYSGEQYITVTMRNVSANYPHLLEFTGSGTLMALGGCKGIMTQRGPQDSIRVYAALSTPHVNWAKEAGHEGKTAAELKTTLLDDNELFGAWGPKLKELLAAACDEDTKDNPGKPADVLSLHMLPIGHRWERQPGTTLVGDAAHLMTPWAGEGVNLGLLDALELAHAIGGVPDVETAAEWQAALEPRVKEYEETMFVRAKEKAEETFENKNTFMSENGGERMANFFKSAYAQMSGDNEIGGVQGDGSTTEKQV